MPCKKITLLKSRTCYTKSLQRGHTLKMFILIKKARIRLKLEKRNSAADFIKRKNKISNLNPFFIKKDNFFGRHLVISSQANLPRF